jgi:hypothetical protein
MVKLVAGWSEVRAFGSITVRVGQIARVQRGRRCRAQLMAPGLRFAARSMLAPADPTALRSGTR